MANEVIDDLPELNVLDPTFRRRNMRAPSGKPSPAKKLSKVIRGGFRWFALQGRAGYTSSDKPVSEPPGPQSDGRGLLVHVVIVEDETGNVDPWCEGVFLDEGDARKAVNTLKKDDVMAELRATITWLPIR